jgi:endoglucanase
MAAGLAATHAGTAGSATGRHGLPSGSRHGVVPAARLGDEDPTIRVLHRPSTAATLHLAAVGAQASRVLRPIDSDYADRLLTAAQTAHHAAHAHSTLIAPDDEGRSGGGPYGDPDVEDDFYWAASELWLATGEHSFRTELSEHAQHTADVFAR